MIDLCSYAVTIGERNGADEIEAFWTKKVSTTIKAEMGEISKSLLTGSEGIRIRVVKNKVLGSAFTYRMDKDSVRKAVEKALAASSASLKDENWDSLPSRQKYPQVDAWDATIEEVSPEDLAAPVLDMVQTIPEDILVRLAAHEVILRQSACVNSSGVEHEDRGTQENLVLYAVGTLKEGVTPSFYEASFLREYNPDPHYLVEEITEKISLFKNRETASSGQFQVVFSPVALLKLFYYTVSKALSGDNVARGKSLLAGKKEEKVASSLLTLHDNGIIPEGIASREMDDEGSPCQDTPLIEKGILHGFIWNDYWAKCTEYASTGNAHYNDRMGEMSIRQSNMVVTPGKYKREQIFDIKDGYYISGLQGAHGSNPESGDFSIVCIPAFRIRKGTISGGVTGMMLSDNIFSLLHKIDAVGQEVEVREFAVLPCIRFTDVNVVAK